MELVAQERATAERLHGAYRQLVAPTRRAIQDAGETVGSVREFDRYVDLQAMQQQMLLQDQFQLQLHQAFAYLQGSPSFDGSYSCSTFVQVALRVFLNLNSYEKY